MNGTKYREQTERPITERFNNQTTFKRAEIRMFGFRTSTVQLNTVNVWIPNDQNTNYAEIQLEGNSDFRQLFGHLNGTGPVRIDL